MTDLKKARVQMSAAMLVFGTLPLFVRHISLTSAQLALWRAVLAAVLIGAYLALSGKKPPLSALKKALPLLLASGAAMGINWILLFEAYKYTTVSAATLSYYFAPTVVTVLSPLIFGERLTKKQLVCFGASTVGVFLIIGVNRLGSSDLKGVLFGLGAAAFYAAVVLLNKAIRGIDGITRTLLQFASAIIVLAPYVVLTGGGGLPKTDALGLACLLTVGLVHTGITYCLYFSSLARLDGQEAAILSYIDPLTAVLVSALLLREGITAAQLFGGALILGFSLWNEMPVQKGKNRVLAVDKPGEM